MRVDPLGDAAMIVRDLPGEAWAVAGWLRRNTLPGLLDAAASYDSIGVYFDTGAISPEQLLRHLEGWTPDGADEPRRHRIPVCYDMGEDLDELASVLSLDATRIAQLHASVEYRCFAVGFCPGFGYLGWLPPQLQGIPRRSSPRVRVEPGSVGIAGKQTAVYPSATPGGWALIGRTPLTLVDVQDDYFPIAAGDIVGFQLIGKSEFAALRGERL